MPSNRKILAGLLALNILIIAALDGPSIAGALSAHVGAIKTLGSLVVLLAGIILGVGVLAHNDMLPKRNLSGSAHTKEEKTPHLDPEEQLTIKEQNHGLVKVEKKQTQENTQPEYVPIILKEETKKTIVQCVHLKDKDDVEFTRSLLREGNHVMLIDTSSLAGTPELTRYLRAIKRTVEVQNGTLLALNDTSILATTDIEIKKENAKEKESNSSVHQESA